MKKELINYIQLESYYWENKATLLTVADIPFDVLEWISELSKEYTKFKSEALGYEVEIHIKPLENKQSIKDKQNVDTNRIRTRT
jgi:hypothetical protein